MSDLQDRCCLTAGFSLLTFPNASFYIDSASATKASAHPYPNRPYPYRLSILYQKEGGYATETDIPTDSSGRSSHSWPFRKRSDANANLRCMALWQRLLHLEHGARYDRLRHEEPLDDRSWRWVGT